MKEPPFRKSGCIAAMSVETLAEVAPLTLTPAISVCYRATLFTPYIRQRLAELMARY